MPFRHTTPVVMPSFASSFCRCFAVFAPLRYLVLCLLLPLAGCSGAGEAANGGEPSLPVTAPAATALRESPELSESSESQPPQPAVAMAFQPAGVVLYTIEDGEVLLLLADHAAPSRQRGWAAFGGMNDPGETIAQTAARETEEETNGYFKREDLLAKIAGQKPVADGKFSFYFVQVDKVPVSDIMSRQSGLLSRFYRERVNFAWIPYAEVERYLTVPAEDDPQTYAIDPRYLSDGALATWFWPVWLNNFRAAKRVGNLPWEGAAASDAAD